MMTFDFTRRYADLENLRASTCLLGSRWQSALTMTLKDGVAMLALIEKLGPLTVAYWRPLEGHSQACAATPLGVGAEQVEMCGERPSTVRSSDRREEYAKEERMI
jgi:hypothetical protein